MLDVSDSLALDASRIADASGVKIVIDPNQLVGFEAVLELAAQSIVSRSGAASAMDWVLYGGEDHSFLATFAAGEVPKRLQGNWSGGKRIWGFSWRQSPRAQGWDSVRREAQS